VPGQFFYVSHELYFLLWAEQHALFSFPCIAARKALVPAAQRVFVHAELSSAARY
jgi:hypothetical protein